MKPVPATALASTFEFQQVAHDKIPLELFDAIEDTKWPGDRRPFDHITLRPRMMVDSRKLDLSSELLGMKLFAPLIANSPAAANARPERFHPEGDKAMAAAAVEARSISIVNGVGANPNSAWFRVTNVADARRMVEAGAKVLVVSHRAVGGIAKAVKAPIVAEGVISRGDTARALGEGAAAIIVSRPRPVGPHPIDVLASVVDKTGKAPVIIGGDFRRGTDILKALAMGAAAVRVTRPVVWALAAYGPEGITVLLEMLQTELARNMAMCGKVKLGELDHAMLRLHAKLAASKNRIA